MLEVTKGALSKDWEKFKAKLRDMFPSEAWDQKGSKCRLEDLTRMYSLISSSDWEKYKIYTNEFSWEISKLMSELPLVLNSEAIRIYLAPFERDLRNSILCETKETLAIIRMLLVRRCKGYNPKHSKHTPNIKQ